ncbi:MAG: hypothetical protein ABIO96_02555 [Nitrospiraceae bacterium]
MPQRPDRNVRRQQAEAINLEKGMTIEKAMLQAGYSPSYAHAQGYKAVKRPCIQSILTDSCERIMTKRIMQFDEIVEPYFDALKAPLIVKSSRLEDAKIPTDPKTEPFPDHALRMDAVDRIVDLFGGKPREVEMPSEPPKRITIELQRKNKHPPWPEPRIGFNCTSPTCFLGKDEIQSGVVNECAKKHTKVKTN